MKKTKQPRYLLVPPDPHTPIYDDWGRWIMDCQDEATARATVKLLNAQKLRALSPKGR